MPEVDYENLVRLRSIKNDDPEKYNNIIREIYLSRSKIESRVMLFISAMSYLITFSLVTYFWYGEKFEQISIFLPKAIIGAFFVMFFSNEFLRVISLISNRFLFKIYPEESKLRISMFLKIKNIKRVLYFIIPISFTLLYLIYTYQ